jgi:UPF0755 protein
MPDPGRLLGTGRGTVKTYQTGEKQPRRWRKWLLISVIILLVLTGIAAGGVYSWYQVNLRPRDPGAMAKQLVVIRKGLGSNAISQLLEEKSLIRSSTAFSWYLSRQGVKNKLQAGTYELGSQMSIEEVVNKLVNGEVARRTVTFPPGRRIDQLSKAMVEAGFEEKAVSGALESAGRQKLSGILPANATLEGYLFAETYLLNLDAPATTVVEQAVSQLLKQLTPDMRSKLRQQNLSIHEAVTLASIIQQESSSPEVQKQIAQVFLLRLKQDISLGADPTFRYGAYLSGKTASPSLNHPYNTRIHKGLPPGPIGNFNATALVAVANPTPGDYLFFVAGDDGVTRFSRTVTEHKALKKKYCIELCKL